MCDSRGRPLAGGRPNVDRICDEHRYRHQCEWHQDWSSYGKQPEVDRHETRRNRPDHQEPAMLAAPVAVDLVVARGRGKTYRNLPTGGVAGVAPGLQMK